MIYRETTLCHYNQYHDPRTGQFTSRNGSGGGHFFTDARKEKAKKIAKVVGKYALKGAVIVASVAAGKALGMAVGSAISGAAYAVGQSAVGNILGGVLGDMSMNSVNDALSAVTSSPGYSEKVITEDVIPGLITKTTKVGAAPASADMISALMSSAPTPEQSAQIEKLLTEAMLSK